MGPQGAQGEPGVSGYQIVQNEPFPQVLFPDDSVDVIATCPAGKLVLGGGYQLEATTDPFFPSLPPTEVSIVQSGPSADGSAWIVTVVNPSATQFGQLQVTLNVICAAVN
jgi:hypothetical protein